MTNVSHTKPLGHGFSRLLYKVRLTSTGVELPTVVSLWSVSPKSHFEI